MNRRSFLFALLGAPTLAALVAACGSDDDPGSEPVYTLPTGPDDVVLRIAYEGGFVAPDAYFARLPNLLVTGDGRVFTPGAIPEIYPGPLVMPMMVGSITAAGLQRLMKAADEARLIGFVADYELPDGIGIADAPDTVVTLSVNGHTYTHRAYARVRRAQHPTRDRLAKFVDSTGDLATLVGAENLGESDRATPPSRTASGRPSPTRAQWSDPKPTIVDWPAGHRCRPRPARASAPRSTAAMVGDLFTSANQTRSSRRATSSTSWPWSRGAARRRRLPDRLTVFAGRGAQPSWLRPCSSSRFSSSCSIRSVSFGSRPARSSSAPTYPTV